MTVQDFIETIQKQSSRVIDVVGASPWPWILALAIMSRIAFVSIPSFYHPDEIFQYTEQAHRLLTGYGIIPWEYRAGARSWLFPLMLAAPMWLATQVGIGAVEAARLMMIAISLLLVFSFYKFGNIISRAHGILLGVIAATWFEFVYFSTRTLTEPAALALYLPAAYLLWNVGERGVRRIFVAGLLLGFAFLLRFHMAPAIAVLVVFTCQWNFRKAWLPAIAGGCVALLLEAGIDVAMGSTPFHWLVTNFAINIFEDRAVSYGVSPFTYYLTFLAPWWQTSVLIIGALSVYGARRYPALYAAALVHLLLHSLIAHKEYRFIILSTSIILLFSAIGFADCLKLITRDWSRRAQNLALSMSILFWIGTSVMLAIGDRARHIWTDHYPVLVATRLVGERPDACGVAFNDIAWYDTGGYSHIGRDVPLYQYLRNENGEHLDKDWRAFNVIIAPQSAKRPDPRYKLQQCIAPIGLRSVKAGGLDGEAICIYVRPAGCDGLGVETIAQSMNAGKG